MIMMSARQRSRIRNWFASAKEFFPDDTVQRAEEIFAFMDTEGGLTLEQLEDLCSLFAPEPSEANEQAPEHRTYRKKFLKTPPEDSAKLLISYLLTLRQKNIMIQHMTDAPAQRR